MSKIERVGLHPLAPVEVSLSIDWPAIAALARVVQVEPVSGAVTITNGAARVTLLANGIIRLEGTRIVSAADERIFLIAPRIDLN